MISTQNVSMHNPVNVLINISLANTSQSEKDRRKIRKDAEGIFYKGLCDNIFKDLEKIGFVNRYLKTLNPKLDTTNNRFIYSILYNKTAQIWNERIFRENLITLIEEYQDVKSDYEDIMQGGERLENLANKYNDEMISTIILFYHTMKSSERILNYMGYNVQLDMVE